MKEVTGYTTFSYFSKRVTFKKNVNGGLVGYSPEQEHLLPNEEGVVIVPAEDIEDFREWFNKAFPKGETK